MAEILTLELNSKVGHLIFSLISLRPCRYFWDQLFGNGATFLLIILTHFSKHSDMNQVDLGAICWSGGGTINENTAFFLMIANLIEMHKEL